MTAEFAAYNQTLSKDALVTLYELDLTPIGVDDVFYHTPDGTQITFAGQAYTYASVNITGVEWSLNGEPPAPKVVLPNANKFAAALVVAHGDLVGAKVTRTRTYRPFLDGEALEDPNAYLSQDSFTIFQKLNLNPSYAEFALRPVASLDGVMLPRRVCMKNICSNRYRRWDSDANDFDYTHATCPFTNEAGPFYTRENVLTLNANEDMCSRTIQGCILRYGTAPLPIRAFPAMSRQ